MTDAPHASELLKDVISRLPPERLATYARLWQFETWLRAMAYVELRACYGDDWEPRLRDYTPGPYVQDRKLSHMPTRETLPTSYMQLGGLLKTISCEWQLFEPYLPPKSIWDAKLLEVQQIRHRVAHFRLGHRYDASRVEQLLRDVDQGFWHFCTSYNSDWPVLPPSKDPVIKSFLHLDPFPWTETRPKHWARIGRADPDLVVSVSFSVLRRPWLKTPSTEDVVGGAGYLYDLTLVARGHREFDYSRFLESTQHLHPSVCHISLDNLFNSVRVTVPAVLGEQFVIDVVGGLVRGANNAVRPARSRTFEEAVGEPGKETVADAFVGRYPEYVLGPSNPLTFLSPDQPCSFFGVS